jgi:hypothetical protein
VAVVVNFLEPARARLQQLVVVGGGKRSEISLGGRAHWRHAAGEQHLLEVRVALQQLTVAACEGMGRSLAHLVIAIGADEDVQRYARPAMPRVVV